MKKKNERRRFIKDSIALGAGVTVLSSCASKNFKIDRTPSGRPVNSVAADDEFDFIVVGAGAGGSVVASRLAQSQAKVLVLEAGEDYKGSVKSEMVPLGSFAAEDLNTSWAFSVRHYEDEGQQQKDNKYDIGFKNKNAKTKNAAGDLPPFKGVYYPRAAALGGCTSHNAMITMYPDDVDWTRIQKISGDSSWSPEKMREYFVRLESPAHEGGFIDRFKQTLTNDKERRGGAGGWLSTYQFPYSVGAFDHNGEKLNLRAHLLAELSRNDQDLKAEMSRILDDKNKSIDDKVREIVATQEERRKKGHLEANTKSYVSQKARGELKRRVIAITQATQSGLRSGPRDLLKEVERNHRNLKIVQNSLVTRLVLNESGEVVGVDYIENAKGLYEADPRTTSLDRDKIWEDLKHGKTVSYNLGGEAIEAVPSSAKLSAKGEVILCGGAFNTPQILMLSGIGDKTHLSQFKDIEVKVNSPWVGKNLQDRYEIGIVNQVEMEGESPSPNCTFGGFTELDRENGFSQNYQKDKECWPKDNDLTNHWKYGSNGIIGGLVMKSEAAERAGSPPDIFIFPVGAHFEGYYKNFSKGFKESNLTWTILKAHTHNDNAGSVKLASSNPLKTPVINFNYFDQKWTTNKKAGVDRDMSALTEAVKVCREMTAKLKAHSPAVKSIEERVPGVKVQGEELKSFIKNNTWGHHASCSCRMAKDVQGGVVNTDFQVFSKGNNTIKGLRVVDASVFPQIPGMFIVLPIYMIAEKAADVIVENYRNS